MNKKGALSLIALVIIAVVVGAILISSGYINTGALTGSGGYIERPIFKYVKCEAVGGLAYSSAISVNRAGSWANKPTVSSSYNLKVAQNCGSSVTYSICNSQVEDKSNCRVYQQLGVGTGSNYAFDINYIRNNEVVRLTPKNSLLWVLCRDKVTYQVGFVPYGLRVYDVLGGSGGQLNPNDCTIPTTDDSWKDRTISSTSSKVSQTISNSVNEQVLQPEEVRWYVSGYVTSASPSFALTYKNQDAWCRTTGTSAEIYKINTVTLGSGTYKIASPDWSDKLGTETCCPGQTQGSQVCSSSFTWKTIAGSECGAFKSCGSSNYVPYSTNTIIKYSCVNGYCKSTTKTVECANDFDCKDSNQVCDLNDYTCKDANVNIKGQVIKTIPDSKADCDLKGGKWITQTSEKKSIFNILGIGEPKVIVKEYCDMSTTNWLLWILIIGGTILLYMFILRPILKSTHLGRFLP